MRRRGCPTATDPPDEPSGALTAAIVESSPAEMAVVDENGRVIATNQAFRDGFLGGAPPAGVDVATLLVRATGQAATDMLDMLRQALRNDAEIRCFTTDRRRGRDRWFDVAAGPLGNVAGAVLRARDVTDLVEAARGETAERSQDHLTGVLSEHGLRDVLVHESRRESSSLCVVMLDIDQFDVIRQTLGHEAADDMIRQVATELRRHVPTGGHLARMMGDEFCITFESQSLMDVDRIASELRDAVRQPITIRGRHVRITASVGTTTATADANLDVAMQHAELAMHEADERGGNRCVVYAPELAAPQEGMVRLWNALRSALQFQQMEVWFQPVVSLGTDRPVAAEALCRWHHPQFGDVAPSVFIPIAERNSEILNIGSFVHGRAAQMMTTLRAGHANLVGGFQICVNASPNELAWPEFTRNLLSRIRANDARPEWFALEITEKGLRQRDDAVRMNLAIARDAGITLSLDDFGTEYSSLERLRDINVDRVKIDRRFVAALGENERGERLISAIIGLAEELGMDTVAEGVETAEQAAMLRAMGCRSAQGFLFAPAVPDSELRAVLHDLTYVS